MALELKSNVRKNAGRTLITSGVAYICSYECTYRATCASFVCRTAKERLYGDRVAKRRLIRFPLMLDPIRKKTLVADLAHADQQAARAVGQEFLAQTCQRWRFGSAEHVRRER